jgi:hypothetical protein
MRIRGTRLSELAAVNIDLIDRNLYDVLVTFAGGRRIFQ